MRRRYTILVLLFALVLAQLACNLPTMTPSTQLTGTPTSLSGVPTNASPVIPPVITATPNPNATQATQSANSGTPVSSACTYKAAFVKDVTIPDDTNIPPGNSFVKTWQVHNEGSCTWGPDENLHALAFTGGSLLGAQPIVPLPGVVQPGQTVDISVNMTAPSTPGTYISQWELLLSNPPSGGPYIGVGSSGTGPLYARIKVGSGDQASLIRLSFEPGATATYVSGDLQPNEKRSYVLAAQQGQVLMAVLSASNSTAKVSISASDKTSLTGSTSPDGAYAMADLPTTQDYIVAVANGDQQTNFSLSITIPSRVSFAPGATSVSLDGTTKNHFPVTYVLHALSGQTMNATLTGNNVGLTIYGLQDGQPLVRAVSGATSFNGKLPATQDYIVAVVPSVASTTFNLKINIQ